MIFKAYFGGIYVSLRKDSRVSFSYLQQLTGCSVCMYVWIRIYTKIYLMLKFGTLHVSRHRAFTGDEDLALEVESQNVPSWKGPTRITKSNSWPHTGPPKKPKPYIQECCPNTSRAPAGQCIWGNSKYHTTQMVGWSYRQILFMAQCVPSIAQLLCGSEKGKEKRLWLLPVILTPVTINTVFCFPTVLLNCPRFADGFLMVCWITCSIPDISKVVNYGPMMSTYVKS